MSETDDIDRQSELATTAIATILSDLPVDRAKLILKSVELAIEVFNESE